MAWSSDGIFLSTFSRDSNIRIYEPRSGTAPIKYGAGPSGGRGGKVIWALDDSVILATGFDKYVNPLPGDWFIIQEITVCLCNYCLKGIETRIIFCSVQATG